jgi:hypothetical protein
MQCGFIVKDGEDTIFSEASKIDGRLTIDLVKLNQVTESADPIQTAVEA